MLFDFMNGGFSYDSATIIANTAQRLPLVLAISSLAFLGGFVQMIAAIWIGFKHRTHGVPLLCVTWFFAHDTTYFLNYQHWFHESNFWVSQGAWFQMGFYMITESIVLFQIMKYSRAEVFPGMNFAQALCSLIGLQVFAFALFWWFMSMINDPLYLIKFASTSILSPMLLIPMMRARQPQGLQPAVGGWRRAAGFQFLAMAVRHRTLFPAADGRHRRPRQHGDGRGLPLVLAHVARIQACLTAYPPQPGQEAHLPDSAAVEPARQPDAAFFIRHTHADVRSGASAGLCSARASGCVAFSSLVM